MPQNYARVGSPTCPSCSRAYALLACRWRVSCPRCAESLCRPCFSPHWSAFLCLPLPLSLTRFGVCDGCFPDADLEARFSAAFAAPLLAGALVVRLVPPIFGGAPERQPVWLSLSAPRRALVWRSMEMVRQEPKESGEVPLSALGRVERGGGGGGGAVGAAGDEVALRLLGAGKGARVLLAFAVRGERAAALWEGGCALLPQLARARNSALFAADAAGTEAAAAAASNGAAGAEAPPQPPPQPPPLGAIREANKVAREAFKEKLRAGGPVTLAYSAQALASRSPGEGRKGRGGKAGAGAGAGGGLGRSLGTQLASAAARARGAAAAGGEAGGGSSVGAAPPSLRAAVADAGDALKRGFSRLQVGFGALLARPSN